MAVHPKSPRGGRKRDYLEAAWRCLARESYRDLTVEDVCGEAGLSKGASYGYFGGKLGLLAELAAEEQEHYLSESLRIEQEHRGIVERLYHFAEVNVGRGHEAGRTQVRVNAYHEIVANPEFGQMLAGRRQANQDVVRRWVTEAVNSGEIVGLTVDAIVDTYSALVGGLVVHGGSLGRDYEWIEVEPVLRAMFQGIASGTRPSG